MRLWGLLPLSAQWRRGLRGAAAIGAALVLLAGCAGDPDPGSQEGSDGDPGTTQTDDDAGAPGDEMPQVSAEFGSSAEMTFPDSGAPEGLRVEVLEEGDGEVVAEEAPVVADYAGHVWGQAEPFDSSFERGAPAMFALSSVVQGWSRGIPGHPVGSRLLISIPPELGYGASGNPDAGIGGEDTIVFVVDVIDTAGPDAAGAADATPVAEPEDLPVTIEGELGSPALLTVREDAPEPPEATVQVIAEGDGDVLAPGHTVALAYSVVSWTNEERDSTWPEHEGSQDGPWVARIGQGQWADLLVDVPEGSRVLITMPQGEGAPGVAILTDIILTHGA
ncbi:FKBP-type peptidyl-prolyl cis-trans isomerase [Pseudactinotalea sp. Z1739]|uniref:FKBP-type peptidyl-prolyl cis-trans isomerase n=1 Tax=Pseudactinotalea sp. Z1739 TaxID=3413028 RepID=UPI003C7A90D2